MVTSDVRASLQTLIEAIQAVINDSAGGELEGDYAGCVAVSMDLIGTMEDALSALIAEGPSQQEKGKTLLPKDWSCLRCGHAHYFEADESGFDSGDDIPWGTCKTCDCKVPNYREAAPRSAPATAHAWLWDDIAGVYRCNGCLVRSDRPHGPTCPKPAPATAEEPKK